jgi:hypothetical protein
MDERLYAEELHAMRRVIFDVYRSLDIRFLIKATGMRLGLLIDSGSYPNTEIERRIL